MAEANFNELMSPDNMLSSRFESGGFTSELNYTGFMYHPNDMIASFRLIESGSSPVHMVAKFF